MTTAATVRANIYDYLYGAYSTDRPFETPVQEPLDNTETDITVLSGTDWSVGDIAETEAGEQMLVISISSDVLTVQRGYGTVAATTAADKSLLSKNPRFTIQKVDNAIREACNILGSFGVHGFGTGSITFASGQYYYNISDTDVDEMYGVIAVYYVDDNSGAPVYLPFRQNYELSSADADWSSNQGVTILDKGDRGATASDIYYTYAVSLRFDTDLDTTLAKLAAEQEELVVLGAVARMIGKTIIPATQDPGARTDRTVSPGQTSRDGRWFQGEFYIKARLEAARLSVVRGRTNGGTVRGRRAGRWRS